MHAQHTTLPMLQVWSTVLRGPTRLLWAGSVSCDECLRLKTLSECSVAPIALSFAGAGVAQ